jgi:hypothetical protein
MAFDRDAYGPEVAAILALDGAGERLMPLSGGRCSSERARELLKAAGARKLFPSARAPEAALAGLFLYFSCSDEAHEVAQSVDTREGSYWHAIVHRQEPDAGNSGYWFGRVGVHPIFPALRERAAALGVDFGPRWDPIAFIEFCGKARAGSDAERRAQQVQRAEWQLLFDYCAVSAPRSATDAPA